MTTAADRNPANAQHRDRGDATLDRLLTVDDVAALLQVGRSWVYEHTRSRGTARTERLPFIKIGKYKRFDRQSIHEFLRRRSTIA
jgi:excisionase family DNA binding protein